MKKVLLVAIVILSLTGILIEIIAHSLSEPVSFLRGLSIIRYFTIQSNLLVFIYFTLYFSKVREKDLYKKMLPGVVIYITITFVVFATMLEGTFEITGIRIWGNYLVHYIVPILSILYLGFYGRFTYTYKDIGLWIIYPFCYIIFMIIFGSITNDYLYPFFDLNTIGILQFIITIILLVLFSILLSFIFMKIVSKKELTNND